MVEAEEMELIFVVFEPFDDCRGVNTITQKSGGIGYEQSRKGMASSLWPPWIGHFLKSVVKALKPFFNRIRKKRDVVAETVMARFLS